MSWNIFIMGDEDSGEVNIKIPNYISFDQLRICLNNVKKEINKTFKESVK